MTTVGCCLPVGFVCERELFLLELRGGRTLDATEIKLISSCSEPLYGTVGMFGTHFSPEIAASLHEKSISSSLLFLVPL